MNIRTIVFGIVTLTCLTPYHRLAGKEPPPPSQSNADSYYEQGNDYLRANRCSEAVEAFTKSIALRPSTGAYNDLGRAYFCVEKYPEAEASFKQAIRINSNNTLALLNLGVFYARRVKIEDANNVLLELRSKDPGRAKELEDEIGNARLAKRQMDEADRAIAGAKKAFEELSKGNALVAEGNKYSEAKDYVKAIDAYKKAISLSPSTAAYRGLGLAYAALKQYQNALSAFHEGSRKQPRDANLHYNLAGAYFYLEQYEKAESSAREALRLKPDYADAVNVLGLVKQRLKQYPEAVAEFEKAIVLSPTKGQYYHNLGKTYFLMGRKEDAQGVYKKLVTLDKAWAQQLYDVLNPPPRKRSEVSHPD